MGFDNYKGSIKLGAGLTPAAPGYPLMQSCDIQVGEDGKTLAEFINEQGEGISAAIIDVLELPTENINENVFYRTLAGRFFVDANPLPWTCHIVEDLPDTGEPATSDIENFIFYYSISTGSVSGYADDALGAIAGIPAGWYDISLVMSMLGASWGGITYNDTDIAYDPDIDIDIVYLLFKWELHQYKDRWYNLGGNVGLKGEGYGAEVFNGRNRATGDYSHAEGNGNHAAGDCSHTEGDGNAAHGYSSHAEGALTYAGGHSSHTEGQDTMANGEGSHAEGKWTIANGDFQHAQGKYNIEDTENKYAHIVGNGIDSGAGRSNAHTLDWGGTAWFAGDVKVGGTGQDDPNAKTLTPFTTDETLSLENGVLSVNVASSVEGDNTLPISSAAVATTVGNIEILLKTI